MTRPTLIDDPRRAAERVERACLVQSITVAIDGRIQTAIRRVLLERKRCFCGSMFMAKRRGHVYCSPPCKRRAKHLKARAKAVVGCS